MSPQVRYAEGDAKTLNAASGYDERIQPSHEPSPAPYPSPDLFVSEAGSPSQSSTSANVRTVVAVRVEPKAVNKEEYVTLQAEQRVWRVLAEVQDSEGFVTYKVKFRTGHTEELPFDQLIDLPNGSSALEQYEQDAPVDDLDEVASNNSDIVMLSRSATRKRARNSGSRKHRQEIDSSDGDEIAVAPTTRARRTRTLAQITEDRRRAAQRESALTAVSISSRESVSGEGSSGDSPRRGGSRRIAGRTRSARASAQAPIHNHATRSKMVSQDFEEDEDQDFDEDSASFDNEEIPFLTSDVLRHTNRKRKLVVRPNRSKKRLLLDRDDEDEEDEGIILEVSRRSGRSTRHQRSMQEVGVENVYRSDSEPPARTIPKALGARETFKLLPRSSKFRLRHCQQCDTCGQMDNSSTNGQLIYCQGCTMCYHRGCLGNRTSRDHLVTKVGEGDFVLQCRRCVNAAKKREHTAPDQGKCEVCKEKGPSCPAFRERKSALQEEREREENGGNDPIIPIEPFLVNNADHVLFRCTNCWRAFHFHHLPSRVDGMDFDEDDHSAAESRFRQYSRDWKCKDCANMPAKVAGLITWRPVDEDTYIHGLTVESVDEDEKEYLIKWEKQSYLRAAWMPGAWTWGVTVSAMRKAFARKENGNNRPKMRTEDAIPEEWLRIDIVIDIRYTSIIDIHTEEVDKARISEVDQALIKYKGLTYEDAVWEKVPTPDDGDRWVDFVTAYNDWVLGRYVHVPKATPLRNRLEKARSQPFEKLEKKKQPDCIVGELMKYQLDGLNWLYYKWYSQKNAILADEMGLGKTIQIIAFLATLVQEHNCFPFLVVVPNSTCPNWRREIKQWAPSLRVVTYFGSAASRELAYKYELFPDGSKDLRCHIVVTSYDAAADENCRKFFRSVPWAGLVVDEGQRLKNDKNQLYAALGALKVPFRVLLTGTPLQNNARELFNLLQFLDSSFDAAALELEYAELTKDNVPQLHDLIRPFFLRRTKAQVLTFLPPMAQIIVPVSMSVVQKKLYMSILAKNPDLIKAIFGSRALKQAERANLSNILMQLRKCLCHPFVYSKEIEERTINPAVSHRNLVDASAKLQLLEIMLPKLKQRGHRVLIFSQFLDELDIVEDFLDGLGLPYQRLDGTISSLQKQKRIDEFNAPDSPLFAFLLSTRAGGVGINLATADTVIILDPDFNPHQDIQALSRAHRIGQKKKVLCFQLMTRASVEEKIVQIGRKKMALDHVLIESMDADEDAGVDTEAILRHGAAELFDENGDQHDIRYDDASVEKLLDRSQIESTKAGEDKSAESQFSFARVWANDQGTLEDSLNNSGAEEETPDPTLWDKILKERERVAAEEAAARQEALGRGRRARQAVDYAVQEREAAEAAGESVTPIKTRPPRRNSNSDTDFLAEYSEDDDTEDELPVTAEGSVTATELEEGPNGRSRRLAAAEVNDKTSKKDPAAKAFKRANVVIHPGSSYETALAVDGAGDVPPSPIAVVRQCLACNGRHPIGSCPLKIAGVENCPLCGLAHFGVSRTCPHIRSETQVREMLAALKQSPESRHIVDEARRYLSGVKGTLVQSKRQRLEKAAGLVRAAATNVNGANEQNVLTMYQKENLAPIYRFVNQRVADA